MAVQQNPWGLVPEAKITKVGTGEGRAQLTGTVPISPGPVKSRSVPDPLSHCPPLGLDLRAGSPIISPIILQGTGKGGGEGDTHKVSYSWGPTLVAKDSWQYGCLCRAPGAIIGDTHVAGNIHGNRKHLATLICPLPYASSKGAVSWRFGVISKAQKCFWTRA